MPPKVPKEDVLADIRRVADELGKVPTRKEYTEHGEYSEITPRAKCGSWSAARKEAGLEGGPTQNTWVNEKEAIEELQRVAEKLGHSPSQAEFAEHGKFTYQVVFDRFGSFNAGKEAAGLETHYDGRIPDETLLEDIRNVAEEAEAIPSQAIYREYGGHGLSVIKRRFGSWSGAVRRAGFEPRTVGPPTGKENPAWEGGYEPYYGPNWYEQRRKARKRDEYECVACGVTDEAHKEQYGWELEVHHIIAAGWFGDDYESMNDLSNLITLCRPHHLKYERLPAKECDKLKS